MKDISVIVCLPACLPPACYCTPNTFSRQLLIVLQHQERFFYAVIFGVRECVYACVCVRDWCVRVGVWVWVWGGEVWVLLEGSGGGCGGGDKMDTTGVFWRRGRLQCVPRQAIARSAPS